MTRSILFKKKNEAELLETHEKLYGQIIKSLTNDGRGILNDLLEIARKTLVTDLSLLAVWVYLKSSL